jgi:hypothetical protein
MLTNPQPPRIHLPKGWQDCVKSAVLHAIAQQPVRQWVLSFPYSLRFLFASRPAIKGEPGFRLA